MNRLIENFTKAEFECRCGECERGYQDMQPGLLDRLEVARKCAEVPFVVTSAVRCANWNHKVGGVDSSAHIDGWAVDIAATDGMRRWRIVRAFQAAGINRIGIASNFIHADCDPRKPANVIWTY